VRDRAGLGEFKRLMQPAWRHTLQIEWPTRGVRCRAERVRETEGFTAAALLTLALGIGANATVFTWLKAVIFNPSALVYTQNY